MQLSYCIQESEQAGGDMSDEVLVERRGAVQVITINRPEARNALNGAVAAGVRDAVDELDADGALLLARRIPRALALEMLLTGDPFDARRAAEIGLVNRVVDDGQALDAAIELAGKIAANGPLALMATKEISNGGADWSAAERW